MHVPPPDALKLAEAFKDNKPAYLKLIPHEGCLRKRRAQNISWKQLETLFQQECGETSSYSTLRRFLGHTDRLRATWAAETPADAAASPDPALPREESPDTAERDALHARIEVLEAERDTLRSEGFEREEQIVAQQHEIAELLQRNFAFEAERDAFAAQTGKFEDWQPAPAAPRYGFTLGLLAGLILAALALAAWLWWSETPLRGLAAFAEASAYELRLRRGPGWTYSLHRHRGFLYVEGAVIAAGLLCGLGALRLCALAALVWLTYSALIHRLYPAFWILLVLTLRVAASLFSPRREFP